MARMFSHLAQKQRENQSSEHAFEKSTSGMEGTRRAVIPHSSLGSSEASPQSSSPSHVQRDGMQRPESLQRNSSTPHFIWAVDTESVSVTKDLQVMKNASSFAKMILTAVGWFVWTIYAIVVSIADPDTRYAAFSDGTLELVGSAGHLSYNTNTTNQPIRSQGLRKHILNSCVGDKSRYSRQSFSSSPWPQLFWPLQRKIPGIQRLGWEHLNWLGRQTWMSEGERAQVEKCQITGNNQHTWIISITLQLSHNYLNFYINIKAY